MITVDLFNDTTTNKNTYFDESPKVKFVQKNIINSSSINTNEIDAFRQGVEIKSFKHFDAGLVKIYAGEIDHQIKGYTIGATKTFESGVSFKELDYFNPVEFLRAQESESTLYFDLLTYPIITGDNDQIENYSFNGIIEPLSIRPKISFFSIDHPFESHDVRGSIMGGNVNIKNATALIDNRYEHLSIGLSPYNDMVEMFNGKYSLGAFYNESEFTSPSAFDDSFCTNYKNENDEQMKYILQELDSDDETSLNNCRNHIIITSGFTYDGSLADSIAFGGMTY